MTDFTLYALPIFFILIIVEILVGGWKNKQSYSKKDTVASLSMFVGNVVIILATKSLFYIFYAMLYEYRIFEIENNVWGLIGHFIAIDFVFYWFHRFSHQVRFLWASHVNHHSSEHLNFSTALRQSWTGPFMRPLFYWVLPVLGFDPLMMITMGSLATIYGFWTHTEHIGKLGALEWILVTPSHHRVHHGCDAEYVNHNYANVFIIWDRAFGTFASEKVPVTFGLTQNIKTFNLFKIVFHEWIALSREIRSSKNIINGIQCLLKPPGWKPLQTKN
tara:strand:+ start:144 stop:968 length:825 start_codon:yes stop_codon:yes gene_type:complete